MKKKFEALPTTVAATLIICSILLIQGLAMAAQSICLVSPVGEEMYRSGETIPIHWIAEDTPACGWQLSFYYRWEGSSTDHFIGSTVYQNEGIYNGFTAPFVTTATRLFVIAHSRADGGGVCAETYSYYMTIQPATAIRTLNLLTPNPNPCDNTELILSAGDTYQIVWDAKGCFINSQRVKLYFQNGKDMDWQSINGDWGTLCQSSYKWTVPNVDTRYARIKAEWHDLVAQHRYPFTITPLPVNYCPVADAGNDLTVNEQATVTLDGRGSHDPEGDYFNYKWELIEMGFPYESQVILSGAFTDRPTFTAPNVSVPVDLDFRLTVYASIHYPCNGDPDEDIVTVTVTPLSASVDGFTPREGWYRTPVTIFGQDMYGYRAYLGSTEVSVGTIPLESDEAFSFFTPDLELGYYSIQVGELSAPYLFRVLDKPYQWQWGFQFHNPSGYDLSWSDYVNAFGYDAVTWEHTCCDWDGLSCERHCHSRIAQAIFDGYVKTMTRGGSCWGMSVASLKFLEEDFTLPYTGHDEVRDLIWYDSNPDYGITREIRQLHITQLSAEVIAYLVDHLGDRPSDHVARIIDDTSHWRDKSHPDYTPGVISIQHITPGSFTGFSGHAMVPDHVEEISPDVYRIYLYDSNREALSTSMDNTNIAEFADITNWVEYPYITVDASGTPESWSFNMGSVTWTANSSVNITISLGNSEIDVPFYGLYYFPPEISVRDNYTFPTSLRGLGMILSGSANAGVCEPDGDLLGYDATGQLHFEIAGGLPIVPMAGPGFPDKEFYLLPEHQPYLVDIHGLEKNGTYTWKAVDQTTLFGLKDSYLGNGGKDSLFLDQDFSSLNIVTTEPDKSFSVEMVKTLTLNGITYQRVFEVLNTSMDNNGEAWFRTTPDMGALVYANTSGLDASFTARFIQTQLDPQPEPPDSPADINDQTLILQEVKMKPGTVLKLTPSNWNALGTSSAQPVYYAAGTLPDYPGDTDYDGDVDGLDLFSFLNAFVSGAPEADLNLDGETNVTDLNQFAGTFGMVD